MHLPNSIVFFILYFISCTTAYVLPGSLRIPFPWKKKTSDPSSVNYNDDGAVIDFNTRGYTGRSPRDLEDAVSETMWKMKVFQEHQDFLATRPKVLRSLFKMCEESVEVATSSIPAAGNGLFASQNVKAGTIISMYPVHFMGVNFADGTSFMQGPEGYDYTKSKYVMSLIGNRPLLDIDLKEDFDDGMGFVDADPTRSVHKAWQCHFINDGAIIQKNTPESVVEYYCRSLPKQNAIFLPVGPAPFVAAVSTKDICKGDEIFTCYGRSYWLGLVEPDRELWSPRTEEIELIEQKIANAIEDASAYISSTYADEEEELQLAFNDIW